MFYWKKKQAACCSVKQRKKKASVFLFCTMGTIQVSYLFPYPSLRCLSKPSLSTTSTLRLQLSWLKTTYVKKMPSRQLRWTKSWYLENNSKTGCWYLLAVWCGASCLTLCLFPHLTNGDNSRCSLILYSSKWAFPSPLWLWLFSTNPQSESREE